MARRGGGTKWQHRSKNVHCIPDKGTVKTRCCTIVPQLSGIRWWRGEKKTAVTQDETMGRKRCRGDPLDNTAGRISSGANSPEWTNKSGLPGRDKRWEERRSLQPTRPAANANLCNNQNAIHFPSDDCGTRAGLYCLFAWEHKRYALILYSSIVELVHCMCECGAKWAQLRRAMPPCERTDEGFKLGGKEQSKATCCFLYVPKNNSNIGKKTFPTATDWVWLPVEKLDTSIDKSGVQFC